MTVISTRWRSDMPFQIWRKWHIPMASNRKKSIRWAWLTIGDKVKVPPCLYKVMHRKRVTCELHDSYFRSITITYAIPKMAEVTHPDRQISEFTVFGLPGIDTRLTKAWTAIDRLSIIWKSNLTDKMKRSFFKAAVVSILLYGCTTWTLTKRLEKKIDGNYTRMLRAILNKSWRQNPSRHQLYGHLPHITKTILARRTRHAGHYWRSKNELVSDVLLRTPAYGQSKAGRPARTYIQQLCEDTGCNPEDLPEATNDWETWRERVRDICACCTTWWWWWPFIMIDVFATRAKFLQPSGY